MDDEKIPEERRAILDDAMAKYSLKIKLANCDQFAAIIFKRLGEEIEWPLYEDEYTYSYKMSKCFCEEIDHCIVKMEIERFGSGFYDKYTCIVDPWINMNYEEGNPKNPKKIEQQVFIVNINNYSLGKGVTEWNVFKIDSEEFDFQEVFKARISEEQSLEIDNWIEEFTKENKPEEYQADIDENVYFENDALKSKGANDSFELEVTQRLDM